jgi:hypothetical protein
MQPNMLRKELHIPLEEEKGQLQDKKKNCVYEA